MKKTPRQAALPSGDEQPASPFANTEFVPADEQHQAETDSQADSLADSLAEASTDGNETPVAVVPEGSTPDVLTDLSDSGITSAASAGEASAKPTLTHIGRYALKERLAVGGLGAVYEAWDPLLSRTVAVKMLQFDVDMPSRVSLDGLFLNEARTAASLAHRGIVTVHDAGLSAHGVYIAMERLVGRDLRDALAQGWRPSPARAALLARRVAEALAYAHGKGIVHCDIKPANIFLSEKLRPKVLDFGIARAAGTRSAALQGLIVGSPHYLAPEQLRGGEIDARTDVYALGVVLWELLTGRKAFDGASLEAITDAVLNAEVPPAHELHSKVPSTLSAITAQAMARDPAARHQTAAAFAQALRSWLEPDNSEERQRAGAGASTGHPGAALPNAAHGRQQPRRSRRLIVSSAAVAATLVGAAAAHWLLRPAEGDTVDLDRYATAASSAETPAAPSTPAPVLLATDAASPLLAGPVVAPAEAAASQPASGRGSPFVARVRRGSDLRASSKASTSTAATTSPSAAPSVQGAVRFAITPWGHVDVNGATVGTTPPMTMILLPIGEHQVVVRNNDATPYTTTIQVEADRPAVVRHRFGP